MSEPTARDEARDAAIYSLIVTVVSLALQVGIMFAFANRDSLTRLASRYRWHLTRQQRKEREDQLVAELHRDISEWEHRNAG